MYTQYKIIVQSKLQTPLQSDTIYGHFCWGLRYHQGEEALSEFLDASKKGPPILISSALPAGFVPRPELPSLDRKALFDKAKELGFGKGKAQLFSGMSQLKEIKKKKWLSIKQWHQIRHEASDLQVISELADSHSQPKTMQVSSKAHNTISRLDNTVIEPGGLYFTREYWTFPGARFDLYCFFENQHWKSLWEKVWMEYIIPFGFGKDKSTGSGQLEFHLVETFSEDIFQLDDADAWMSLSHCVLDDYPTNASWFSSHLKKGRLGGEYAVHGPGGGKSNPFKKSILMQLPGSVLKHAVQPKGRLLENVHSDERICHFGLGLFLPLRLGGEA